MITIESRMVYDCNIYHFWVPGQLLNIDEHAMNATFYVKLVVNIALN